jgi:hypothetical protein
MVIVYGVGDRDLALALLAVEGFELARGGLGPTEPFRCAEGWEQRVVYSSARRNADRKRDVGRKHRRRAERAEAAE